MSVYVDQLLPCVTSSVWPYPYSCHLIADSTEELHNFAINKIGLKKHWFQNTVLPHYDLTANKRAEAVKNGAVEISREQFVKKLRKARKRHKCS